MTTDKPRRARDPLSDAEDIYFARDTRRSAVDIDALCDQHPPLAGELRVIHERWRRFQSAMAFESAVPDEQLPTPATHPGTDALQGSSSDFVGRLSEHTPAKTRYQLRGKIAQGGMGAILKVWDEPLKRDLAMKVVLGKEREGSTPAVDEATLSRFLEEALITGQLDHPGVVPVHELGVDHEGRVYFTMRLVKGRDLKAILHLVRHEQDGWNRTRALGTVQRACEALAYAHSKGVVHRDLKPANIMVGQFGEVYVMDWGLAKVRDRSDTHDLRLRSDSGHANDAQAELTTHRGDRGDGRDGSPLLTMDGSVIGTPANMSPEQARGEIDLIGARSDVYAMGTVLYELLTGQPPYVGPGERGPARRILESILDGPPQRIRELVKVPAELEAICEKAMARQPSDRYADIVELADDLRAYLENRVVAAYATGALAELSKWVSRNRPLAAALVSVVLLLAAGLTASMVIKEQSDDNARRADASAQEALAQKMLADASAEEARANAQIAQANALRAEAERANVLRLSAFQELEDLQRLAELLWPATPELLSEYDDWLRRAEVLVQGLLPSADGSDAGHRMQLQRLRERALPATAGSREADRRAHARYAEWEQTRDAIARTEVGLAAFRSGMAGAEPSAEQAAQLAQIEAQLVPTRALLATLEAEVSTRRTFTFASGEDTWWSTQLTRLIGEIEAFSDPVTGLVAGQGEKNGWGMAKRRDFAATIGDHTLTGPVAIERWERAIRSIADGQQCPAYGGLQLKPQLGLLPIGRDPQSGLWEFWHVQSGEEPFRGDDQQLVINGSSGIVLVLIPGGSYRMGAQKDDPGGWNYDPRARLNEGPVHLVSLSPFFVSKYEMTQGQWGRFTRRSPSQYGARQYFTLWNRDGLEWSPQHPLESVSWDDCMATLPRLGLTLPTEAQWEYACRAGTSTPYWSGVEPRSLQGVANISDQYGKTHGNEYWSEWEPWLDDGQTNHARVGFYRANALGLHDTHGNVWEWCRDEYDRFTYENSAVADPLSDDPTAMNRVFRGGSCVNLAPFARSAIRDFNAPESRLNYLGLRPARALSP